MSEPTLEDLAYEIGRLRALADLNRDRHFYNGYPANTPEHHGYESLAAPIRARINRYQREPQRH